MAAMAWAVGPMKVIPAASTAWAKGRAFGEEAVAGVDRLGAGRASGLDDEVGPEVRFGRGRTMQELEVIRLPHVERTRIRLGGNRHCLDAHAARRPDDAAGDLAAIGDQDALEGRGHQSGMLSCFLGGLESRLSRSMASVRMRRVRVVRG